VNGLVDFEVERKRRYPAKAVEHSKRLILESDEKSDQAYNRHHPWQRAIPKSLHDQGQESDEPDNIGQSNRPGDFFPNETGVERNRAIGVVYDWNATAHRRRLGTRFRSRVAALSIRRILVRHGLTMASGLALYRQRLRRFHERRVFPVRPRPSQQE